MSKVRIFWSEAKVTFLLQGARCGVAKVQGDGETSLLPYTLLGGAKWVPLAYFEGEVGDDTEIHLGHVFPVFTVYFHWYSG